MMRLRARVVALVALAASSAGCGDIFGLDNYEPPRSTLSGRVVFDGVPVGVRSRAVELELWQLGEEWELDEKIPVHLAQDGTFEAVIFDGDYEINLIPGGPWVDDPERIPIQVRGGATVEIAVQPYFAIRNEQFTNTGGAIQATFQVDEIAPGRQLEYVGLYVATTAFVDRINQVARIERTPAQLGDMSGPLSLTVDLPDDIELTPGPEIRENVRVRLGVKISGIEEMLFTQIQEIDI